MRKLLLIAVAFCGLLGAVAGAATYPSPAPDFSHYPGGHAATSSVRPSFSTSTGSPIAPRPLLVIYARFTEFSNPPTPESVRDRFFADAPARSIRDYFFEASGGDFLLNPARESSGQADDGVVTVDLGSFAEHEDKSKADQMGTALNAADPFVDLAQYDANDDDFLTGDELAIVLIRTHSDIVNAACGVNWNVPPGKSLDGKTFRLMVAEVNTPTNQVTIAHELGHQTLGLEDLYLEAIDQTALGGNTCTKDGTNRWRFPSAYERLHWGWVSQPDPVVVTKDGYHTLFSGGSFPRSAPDIRILYDPDKGTDHYFMVEYRQRGADTKPFTYDEGVSDTGLFVWRVQDSRWPPGNDGDIPVNVLVRPVSGADMTVDAWDPADVNAAGTQRSPQRTMSLQWNDGTPSNVAVRAIPAAGGDSMRVYLDVRGPGVLVDPTDATGRPLEFDAPLGGTASISFPVMNTGETTDTFTFKVVDGDLPNAVESTQTMTLAPGQQATANVSLTLPSDLALGERGARVVGKSTTNAAVETFAPFVVNVVKRTTTLVYSGDTSADYSDAARVSARLTDTATGDALAGKAVRFTIGTQTALLTTDDDGVASGEIVIDQPAGTVSISAAYGGDSTYTSSSRSEPFGITTETMSLTYTGSTVVSATAGPSLAVMGTEEADSHPGDRSLARVAFALTPVLTASPRSFEAAMASDGLATTTPTDLPADLWTVAAVVAPDNRYWASPTTSPVELVVFDPTALMTGDASGLDGAASRIAVKFSAQYDARGPKGSANVRYAGGSFSGTSLDWIVHVGNECILQVRGALNKKPTTLRIRARDAGEPGKADTFRVELPGYDSGVVTVTSGNVRSH